MVDEKTFIPREVLINTLINHGYREKESDFKFVDYNELKELVDYLLEEDINLEEKLIEDTEIYHENIRTNKLIRQQYIASLHTDDIIPIFIIYPTGWKRSGSTFEVLNSANTLVAAKIIHITDDLDYIIVEIIDNLDILMVVDNKNQNLDLSGFIVTLHASEDSKIYLDMVEETINISPNITYTLSITFGFIIDEWIADINRREEMMNMLENYGITYPSHIISEYIT